MRVEIKFRHRDTLPVKVDALLPDSMLRKSERGIEKIRVCVGSESVALGEITSVRKDAAKPDELVFSGNTSHLYYAGMRMNKGSLAIEGDAGYGTGMEMTGGEIIIHGSAGDCLGTGMHSGCITVHGDTGDWCGASQPGRAGGMDGGTIIIRRNSGKETGIGMRRGLIFVSGDAGDYTGANMLAGSIIICGKIGKYPGAGMHRGSILAEKVEGLLPGFRPAGFADMEWFRVAGKMLSEVGAQVPGKWTDLPPLRFSGDHLVTGKGELLIYDCA